MKEDTCLLRFPSQSLYDDAKQEVTGPIQYRHSFVDFSKVQLNVSGEMKHTCPPAMGEAFAAGTTDGPGAFDFKQGWYEIFLYDTSASL